MNAPAVHTHLVPEIRRRVIQAGFPAVLQARFGAQCATALAVREQHGRDESIYQVPPPAAVVFAQATQDVADAVALAARHRVPVIPFGVSSLLEGQLLAVEGGLSIDVSRPSSTPTRQSGPTTGRWLSPDQRLRFRRPGFRPAEL